MDCCGNTMAMGRVICPKPRRAGSSNFNNHAMPLRFQLRNDVSVFDSKSGDELMDLIRRKEDFEAERCATVSSSPPFFFGSPPCRAPNPVVQDAYFGIKKPTSISSSPSDSALPPPANHRVKFGKKQAVVRVVGFDC